MCFERHRDAAAASVILLSPVINQAGLRPLLLVQFAKCLKFPRGVFRPAELTIGVAEIKMRRRIIRTKLNRPLQLPYGILHAIPLRQHFAQQRMGRSEIGVQL